MSSVSVKSVFVLIFCCLLVLSCKESKGDKLVIAENGKPKFEIVFSAKNGHSIPPKTD